MLPKSLYNPPYPNNPVKPFRIIGNIYYVGMTNTTSFLISTNAGLILLDTEYDDTIPTLSRSIEELGFKVKDIKIILQAHAHIDHIGGLAGLKELTGAKVLAMAQDVPVVEDGGKSDFRHGEIWKPVHVDHPLRDHEMVTLGDVTMTARLTAGHTRGCTTWTTTATDNGKKYNVVFVCSMRPNDGVFLIGNKEYPTIAEDFAQGFKTLKALPCDVFLASHAFMFDLEGKLKKRQESPNGPNPFIDPEGYKAHLAAYEKAVQDDIQYEKDHPGQP
jgi:metallo-beta-lactamase class B